MSIAATSEAPDTLRAGERPSAADHTGAADQNPAATLPTIRRSLLPQLAGGDPLDAIAMAPGEPAFYWRSDDRDVEIAALGALAVVDAAGPGRFADAAASLEALRARVIDDPATGDDGHAWPLAVGGFAFDDFAPEGPWAGIPALRFFVPRVLWVRRGGCRRVLLAKSDAQTPLALLDLRSDASQPAEVRAGCASGEDQASWRRRVEAAVARIRAGELDKIVLARRLSTRSSASEMPLLRELAATRPGCFTFYVRFGGRRFFGSSPERLLRVQGCSIEADALAGTAARGLSKAHDDALARELAASPKERCEHAIVVDAIRDALAGCGGDVIADDAPSLRTLPEAHHLHTAIRTELAAPAPGGTLALAAKLHPTPAVCGSPREKACAQLAAEERERGWYGGAVGWLAASGDGELAVALRAALLDGDLAQVWAGAGIVDGSEPDREYDETERKMRSILPLLVRGDECAA